jgi:hypothetical protein
MKIKPSLKLYFTIAMLLLGLAMTISFSAFTLNYFDQGLDRGVGLTMRAAADIEGVKIGQPGFVLGFNVTASWDDLPRNIRDNFESIRPLESFSLEKKIIDMDLFGPPTEMYILLKVKNKDGQLRYVAKYLNKSIMPPKPRDVGMVPHIVWIAIFAIASIGFFLMVVLFIIRKIAKPVESLKDWAKSLDQEKLQQPIPDFQYSELNTLATIINSSLSSVQETLARELQFLSHASHELRTPIAVIRANTELLIKLQEKEQGTKKQQAVLERIDRAGKTMTNLTETLLWLSRDDDNLPGSKNVDISQLIELLISEMDYLLKNKNVLLEVETEPYVIDAAEIPCRIVLANLIRNAFQHTLEGNITIVQKSGNVTIINTTEESIVNTSDLGFGLGLQLTKKLADRYHWLYREDIKEIYYQVSIQF